MSYGLPSLPHTTHNTPHLIHTPHPHTTSHTTPHTHTPHPTPQICTDWIDQWGSCHERFRKVPRTVSHVTSMWESYDVTMWNGLSGGTALTVLPPASPLLPLILHLLYLPHPISSLLLTLHSLSYLPSPSSPTPPHPLSPTAPFTTRNHWWFMPQRLAPTSLSPSATRVCDVAVLSWWYGVTWCNEWILPSHTIHTHTHMLTQTRLLTRTTRTPSAMTSSPTPIILH